MRRLVEHVCDEPVLDTHFEVDAVCVLTRFTEDVARALIRDLSILRNDFPQPESSIDLGVDKVAQVDRSNPNRLVLDVVTGALEIFSDPCIL